MMSAGSRNDGTRATASQPVFLSAKSWFGMANPLVRSLTVRGSDRLFAPQQPGYGANVSNLSCDSRYPVVLNDHRSSLDRSFQAG